MKTKSGRRNKFKQFILCLAKTKKMKVVNRHFLTLAINTNYPSDKKFNFFFSYLNYVLVLL